MSADYARHSPATMQRMRSQQCGAEPDEAGWFPPSRWEGSWELPSVAALRSHIGCSVGLLTAEEVDGGLVLRCVRRRGWRGPWEVHRWWGPGSEKVHIVELDRVEGFRCFSAETVHRDRALGKRTVWL